MRTTPLPTPPPDGCGMHSEATWHLGWGAPGSARDLALLSPEQTHAQHTHVSARLSLVMRSSSPKLFSGRTSGLCLSTVLKWTRNGNSRREGAGRAAASSVVP